MTPDQQFARLVKISMAGFVLVFAYFMLADLEMPLTPQAMATRTVVKIAPQVSGPVQSVAVANNQHVEAGQLLFAIDPAPFELALEQAKLALEQAMQDNAELDAAIEAARADVSANEAMLQQKQREARRLDALYASNGVSRQLKDQADTDASSALAKLAASKAQLAKLKVSRGTAGIENLKLRQARSRLAQAELDLSYTKVLAENEGIVTNLQLASGSMANKGQPVLALVSEQLDIIADFREKTLRGVEPGTAAWVAFDAEPGRLYPARSAAAMPVSAPDNSTPMACWRHRPSRIVGCGMPSVCVCTLNSWVKNTPCWRPAPVLRYNYCRTTVSTVSWPSYRSRQSACCTTSIEVADDPASPPLDSE